MKTQDQNLLRRIASNELITLEGECLTQQVVELSEDGQLVRHYPLRKELPFTEWISGQLSLKRNKDGKINVYINNKLINKVL